MVTDTLLACLSPALARDFYLGWLIGTNLGFFLIFVFIQLLEDESRKVTRDNLTPVLQLVLLYIFAWASYADHAVVFFLFKDLLAWDFYVGHVVQTSLYSLFLVHEGFILIADSWCACAHTIWSHAHDNIFLWFWSRFDSRRLSLVTTLKFSICVIQLVHMCT